MRRHLCLPAVLPAASLPAASLTVVPAAAAVYVAEALERNLALQGRLLEVEQARARLAEVRSAFQPRLDLVARYSRADGGRTIDFPTGDLLNGAYRTLNDYLQSQGKPGGFPSVANQSIALLRGREQETKLRLVQPLYRPEITRASRASRAGLMSREAQLAAYRRELRLTVLTAYHGYLQSEAVNEILASAAELTAEALRVNRLLAEAGKVTEDRVLRAQADDLAVSQQRAEASRDLNSARAFLNFLVNRPLTTPVERAPEAELQALADALLASDVPEGGASDRREELRALQSAVAAATASEDALRARLYPTLALAVEGGVQGAAYRTGGDAKFVQGSLVAEVNLWDGRERRSRLEQARLERRKIEVQVEETRQQFALQLQQARDELEAATAAVRTAVARADAAGRAFALVAQRDREGLASQLTFLDARNELTRADLNRAVTRQRLFIAAATMDRAAALSPLP
ncbi:MAG: TolC family protein [Opitutus sp.]|nr:TolC family protein [Opitutus sp.]